MKKLKKIRNIVSKVTLYREDGGTKNHCQNRKC